MASRAKQIALGAAHGLLSGVAGATASAALFMTVYHPHGGGDVGDWTSIVFATGAFVVGIPIGILAGIAWSFSAWPRWRLAAGLCVAGLAVATVALFSSRSS